MNGMYLYGYLHDKMTAGLVKQRDVLGVVLPQGPVISEDVLQIFQELGFIKCDQEFLTLASTQRNPLSNSAVYNKMQKNYAEKAAVYDRMKNITCEEIAALWR